MVVIDNKKIIIFVVLFSIFGCSPNDRNKLIFSVPTKQVEDSIIKLNQLMSKLPTEKGSPFFKNCLIDENGNWIINNINLGLIDNVDVKNAKILSLKYDKKESLRTIVKFLNENKITATYRTGENCYVYSYIHRMDDEHYTARKILIRDESCDYLFSRYEVIDSCGMLLLIKAVR